MSNPWACYNGELIKTDQPAVPIASRGLMYGDGCFDTFRIYNGKYFDIDAHLKRLKAGADFLGLDFPSELSASSVKDMGNLLIKKNKISEGNAVGRIQLWRTGSRGYTVVGSEETRYSLLVSPLPEFRASISLATVEVRRIPSKSLPSDLKLCNNINYIRAAKEAAVKGADDALMQDIDGNISETTIGNIFWFKDDTVYTPSASCDLLPGITREIVMELLGGRLGFQFLEGQYRLNQLEDAEAVWMCNSVRGIVPVGSIDQKKFDPGHAVISALKNSYKTYVQNALTD